MSAQVDLHRSPLADWRSSSDVGPLKRGLHTYWQTTSRTTEQLRLIDDLVRSRVRRAVPVMVQIGVQIDREIRGYQGTLSSFESEATAINSIKYKQEAIVMIVQGLLRDPLSTGITRWSFSLSNQDDADAEKSPSLAIPQPGEVERPWTRRKGNGR